MALKKQHGLPVMVLFHAIQVTGMLTRRFDSITYAMGVWTIGNTLA